MTGDDKDWLTDDVPELRDAPPWVMEEMILAQPALAAPILAADRPEAARLRTPWPPRPPRASLSS